MNADEIVRALRCVQEKHRNDCLLTFQTDVSAMARDAADMIESLQAQLNDVAPVVRGEWLVTDAYPHRVYCSLCYKTNVPNKEWLYEKDDYPKYCMWCGAKMEDKP